ncbi:MAG TPA: type II CAAX endopeptidase family protein [Symbiobacteriaceae bacterium]|nr:type II CAAX endopeptidase family protein [Symbiobacteriaceae bacterium]
MHERGRLLLWGGLVSPLLMILVGGALAWLRLGGAPAWWAPVIWTRVTWAPVVAGASLGGTSLLAKLWPAFGRRLKQSGTSVSSEALAQVGYPVMLVVVAGAALGEEILFRGGVQPWLGPVVAALLFGLSHGGWRPREMWAYVLAATFSGLLFGWFMIWAGTVWAPVFAHLFHNMAAVLLLGKKVDVTWQGGWPRVRLVPDPDEVQSVVEGAPDAECPPLATSEVENERDS